MHGFANILMDDVYYSGLQHEENDLQHRGRGHGSPAAKPHMWAGRGFGV